MPDASHNNQNYNKCTKYSHVFIVVALIIGLPTFKVRRQTTPHAERSTPNGGNSVSRYIRIRHLVGKQRGVDDAPVGLVVISHL